ncbi:MAG: glutathione peroxidase [Flavobacteriaceae bacterium]
MKKLLMTLILLLSLQLGAQNNVMEQTIYQFKVEDIEGNIFDFNTLQGKKIMIVNTASKCGLTPQYKELQAIYDTYGSDDFVIIGFPANDFLSQEPGTNEEIAAFCEKNYGVTFPMMSKITVKGKGMHPVYKFLTTAAQNGVIDSKVTWNFQKYLIGPSGKLEKVIAPRTAPDDAEIINWITEK